MINKFQVSEWNVKIYIHCCGNCKKKKSHTNVIE